MFAAGATGSVVSIRHGTRIRRTREVMLWQPRRSLDAADDAPPIAPAPIDPDAPDIP